MIFNEWITIKSTHRMNDDSLSEGISELKETKKIEMQAPTLHLLPIFFLCFLISFQPCHGADPLGQYCSTGRNMTLATSGYIARLLSALVAKASSDGFATAAFGDGASGGERVYGLAQCRGDVAAADCRSCLSDAARQLPELCPGQSDARIWFDYCFVRYNTRDFVGELDTGYAIFYINTENVTDNATELVRFERELGKLMDKVRAQAVAPGNGGLGKVQDKFTPFVTIYALGQCTQDLPPLGCAQCIATAVGNIPNFCRFRKGCRALYSSCYVRYEIYPFFFPLDSTGSTARARGVSSVAVVRP